MTTRAYIEIGLIALAALLAVLFTNAGRNRAKAEGAAAIYAEQLHVALDSLDLSKATQIEKDQQAEAINVQANAEIAAANARRIQAEQRSDAAAARRPAVIERVIAAAGVDSAAVRVAVVEVADSIVQHEVNPLRAALVEATKVITEKDAQLAVRDAQIAARDRVQADLETALAASRGETAQLRKALPGWFGRNGVKVLAPVALVGGWILRGAIGR